MKKKKSKFTDSAYLFALRKSIGLLSDSDLNMIYDLISVEKAKRDNTIKEIKTND